MNGIHDMGGMHGFGPVDVTDEDRFHEAWEPRARAMAHLMYQAGYINLDAFRFTMEQLPPAEYLGSSYFERWLKGTEIGLIERGYLTQEEVERRIADFESGVLISSEPQPSQSAPLGESSDDAVVQRFAIGDTVRVRNQHPAGHNRAPRYLRGKRGVIQFCRGHEVFPDSNASYQGDRPQVVYNVQFEGREIWGDEAEAGQLLSIDLWDSYLESA